MNLLESEGILTTGILRSLKPYMTQSQRARLEEVQSEKAGITFNHVQRVSTKVEPYMRSCSSTTISLQLHRQRYDELLKATVAKVVAKTANVLIGEIVEQGESSLARDSVRALIEECIFSHCNTERKRYHRPSHARGYPRSPSSVARDQYQDRRNWRQVNGEWQEETAIRRQIDRPHEARLIISNVTTSDDCIMYLTLYTSTHDIIDIVHTVG